MSTAQPVSSVVVVGRDADLWLSAGAIARALTPAGVQVTAVELPTRLSPSHISATLPPLEALHAKLGVNEAALLRATGGSFSFGQNVVAGCRRVAHFFHAWGAYGAPIDGSAFFPCWLKATRHGLNTALQSFCPTAVAAQNGRMLLPDEATNAFGRTDYGYHLQTPAYAAFLKSFAAALGVKTYQAHDIAVERAAPAHIAALTVDGSARIEGRLFVDATGDEALLLGQACGVPLTSWREHFAVDRLLYAHAPKFTSTPPFAEIRTSRFGWTVLHPSPAATGIVHAYSSALISDAAALQATNTAAGAPLAEASFQPVNHGLRSRVWEGNCIAVGGSACRFDPIHDTDLHALQLSVVHLLSLFPVTEHFAAERAEYNRLMHSYYERIRDFQCAFYALAPFEGEFWQQSRARAVPPTLAHKIATFRARGDIAPMEDETFLPESWRAIFTGFGVLPESWPPAIDRIGTNRFKEEFRRIHEFIRNKVLEQPMHDEYLSSLSGGAAE